MSFTKSLIVSHIIVTLFVFSAIFSPGGMNIQVAGYEWFGTLGGIIENFVTLMAWIALFVSGIALLFTFKAPEIADEMIKNTKNMTLVELHNKLKSKPIFLVIAIFSWIIYVGAGWIFATICFILSAASMRFFLAAIRKRIENVMAESGEALNPQDDLKQRML